MRGGCGWEAAVASTEPEPGVGRRDRAHCQRQHDTQEVDNSDAVGASGSDECRTQECGEAGRSITEAGGQLATPSPKSLE